MREDVDARASPTDKYRFIQSIRPFSDYKIFLFRIKLCRDPSRGDFSGPRVESARRDFITMKKDS